MKIKFEMEFDLPDVFSEIEAKDEIWRNLVQYSCCKHLEEPLKYLCKLEQSRKGKLQIDEESMQSMQSIIDSHNFWADTIRDSERTMKFKIL